MVFNLEGLEQFGRMNEIDQKIYISTLLTIFQRTTDMIACNQLALFFADNQVDEAIPLIIFKIKDQHNKKQSGSLIYALRCYEINLYLNMFDFLPVLTEGDWEEAHETYLLIIQQAKYIPQTELYQVKNKIYELGHQNCANFDLLWDLYQEIQKMINNQNYPE